MKCGSVPLWNISETNDLAVDFVTRHHYTSEPPKTQGHYSYIELMDPEDGFANLHTTREIIDSFPRFKGLQFTLRSLTLHMCQTAQFTIQIKMQHTLRISFRALVMITNHIHTGRLVMYLKSWCTVYSISWRFWPCRKWLYSKANFLDICFL